MPDPTPKPRRSRGPSPYGQTDGPLLLPVFATARLRVFKAEIIPCPKCEHLPRDVYFATRTDIDCPMAILTCTVLPDPRAEELFGGVLVEMIEVNTLHRRKGLAREFYRGLAKHLGKTLAGDAVTTDGEKFLQAMERDGNG